MSRGTRSAIRALSGRSVLIATNSQMAATLALIELDGVARRLVLWPLDMDPVHLPSVIATADIDAIVLDEENSELASGRDLDCIICKPEALQSRAPVSCGGGHSEWVLFTSGTTNRPKMVVHDLDSLAAPLTTATAAERGEIWSTFYDIRRYGGMQMLLRALLGGGAMVLSDRAETVSAFLSRAAREHVTHINGTPSHWRRVLMCPEAAGFTPRYVRLSGEIADQGILDRLRAAFPGASVAHAFASTEAGVAFSVDDGRAGFPARHIEQPGWVELRVQDGSLRIRSPATASRYLDEGVPALTDADGFVDTGDMLVRAGDRYVFSGRREGIINVGGQKVHPEEVEAIINLHPRVHVSRARGRRNPMTGAVVVADVVIRDDGDEGARDIGADIIAFCRARLQRHKVPVAVHVLACLDTLATGKMARHLA